MGSETGLTGRNVAEAIAEYDRLSAAAAALDEKGEALRRRTSGIRSLREESQLRELAATRNGLDAERSRLAEDLLERGLPEDVLVPCELPGEGRIGYVLVGRSWPKKGFALTTVPSDVVGVLGDRAEPRAAVRLRAAAEAYERSPAAIRAWAWLLPPARPVAALLGAVLLFLLAGVAPAVSSPRWFLEGRYDPDPLVLGMLAVLGGLCLAGAALVWGVEAIFRLRELARLERLRKIRAGSGG